MRTRITYVHESEGQFDPQQTSVLNHSLSVQALQGAREAKVTVGLDELPQELHHTLRQLHELHIRWATERPFLAIAPFASRISPGLHVSYTPSDSKRYGGQLLCPLLRKTFSDQLKCSVPETSFISSPAAATRTLHFYQALPSLHGLVTYIQQNLCSSDDAVCRDNASTLLSADYTDISYESSSSSLSITVYRSHSLHKDGWTETIYQHNNEKVEVGILAGQERLDPAEIRVGGFIAAVGKDNELKPTLFSFPSRHHPLPLSSIYEAEFSEPTGLHPTLKLSMPRHALIPPRTSRRSACSLHSFVTLPSTVFADKYQLSTTDSLFLQSHNLLSLRSIAGETDLEAPDWVTERWGSNFLLELATPPQSRRTPEDASGGKWEVTVPLHLRYLHPSDSGYRNVSIPWPIVFWACTDGENNEAKPDKNPFDRVDIVWDELFTPRTMFYQLHPSPAAESEVRSGAGNDSQPELVEEIEVPVLRIGDNLDGKTQVSIIELGTVLVVVAGFVWVLWKLGLVATKYGVGRNDRTAARVRKSKSS